jgi:protein-S-isoprenylcysteine O-methyltransferase Ste14
MERARTTPIALWLKVLLFTLVVPGTVIVVGPWLVLWPAGGLSAIARGASELLARSLLGAAALGIGLAIYAWCAWEFAARGRGTPAPFDPPRRLVVSGLYRHVRNPMYVGVVLALLGESLLAGSRPLAIYAASLALAFHLRVRFFEERDLRRLFPEDFSAYAAHVPRWFPRVKAFREAPREELQEA